MGVETLRRSVILAAAAVLAVAAAFSDTPSARTNARIVYDPVTTKTILFGGETEFDGGTKLVYDLGETWEWNGLSWIQRYPEFAPPGRSEFVMVYDSNRSQMVIFGGKNGLNLYLNDTWIYKNNHWLKLDPPSSPSARRFGAAAFDPVRDRIVLFGGSYTTQDPKQFTPTTTNLYDTWEFDGTTWTQRNASGPNLNNPVVAYDEARSQVIMIGMDDKSVSKMYVWVGDSGTWQELTPPALPKCHGGGAMTWDPDTQAVMFTGGICTDGTISDDTYEWDGTNWTALVVLAGHGSVFGQAMTWDRLRDEAIMFGGAVSVNVNLSSTYTYTNDTHAWLATGVSSVPSPRSLAVFKRDAQNQTIWMFGGLNESQVFYDFWKFTAGRWEQQVLPDTDSPAGCSNPVGTMDPDRGKLVMVCQTADVFEFDGTNWKEFAVANQKNKPPTRRFSSLSYDPKLKKTVLFGGWDDSNYLDQTWVWDGATWNRVKNKPPTQRASASMFFDSISQKTILYGGVGRVTTTDAVSRFADMWSFDGNGWTAMTVSPTPTARYGAGVTSDPNSGHTILYGGLRLDTINNQPVQVYANDQWDWDGTKWTQVTLPTMPPPRENFGLAFDPTTGRLVLFGGYSGSFYSDVWTADQNGWRVTLSSLARRRAAGVPASGSSPSSVPGSAA
jgi:hypothetical protein